MTFVGACHLEAISSGGLGLSLIRRGDEAHKEMMGNRFGGVRAALATGERFGTLCSFVLMTFLSSGRFIIEEVVSPKLAESWGSRIEGLRVIDNSLVLFRMPAKATRTSCIELRNIELAKDKVCISLSSGDVCIRLSKEPLSNCPITAVFP
jgi:hypothetical protein